MIENTDTPGQNPPPKRSLIRLIFSTVAAAFGVQSETNRQHDFQQKSIMPYLLAGLLFTAIFLGSLIFIVSLIVD